MNEKKFLLDCLLDKENLVKIYLSFLYNSFIKIIYYFDVFNRNCFKYLLEVFVIFLLSNYGNIFLY